MITALSLILIACPFLLVILFKDKARGAVIVFSALALVHVLLALVTQACGWFEYSTLLVVHSMVALSCVLFLIRELGHRRIRVGHLLSEFAHGIRPRRRPGSLFALACAALAFFLLFSIHYNFSGQVDTGFGLRSVSRSSYAYPLYSDEWVGASLASYSVRSHGLPIVNPLDGDRPFPNFLFVSHSLISELLLVLDMNPVTQYVQVGMLNSLLVLLLLYAIMRRLRVRRSLAALAGFSALLLTNSGNLPGLWFLLPYSVSLAFLLAAILSAISFPKEWKIFISLIALSLLLYPPMIIFAAPVCVAAYSQFKGVRLNFGKYGTSFAVLVTLLCLLCGLAFIGLFMLRGFSSADVVSKALSYVIRPSLDLGRVYYAPWNIFPWHLIPFLCIGLVAVWNARIKPVTYPLAVGIVLWVVSMFTSRVILVEPARIVVIVSVLAIIAVGIGFEKTYEYLRRKTKKGAFDLEDPMLNAGMKIMLIVFLAFWTANISKFGTWHHTPLYMNAGTGALSRQKLIPAPPVTRYLSEDDIRLFAPYEKRRFIAPSWKGLVIGATTHNYPLDSKSATITNSLVSYEEFEASSCDEKTAIAQKYGMTLAYSKPFSCGAFVDVGRSPEGLHLYEFRNSKQH